MQWIGSSAADADHTQTSISATHDISSKSSGRVPNIDQASRHCLANEERHTSAASTHTQ